jgi:hypothetical protein
MRPLAWVMLGIVFSTVLDELMCPKPSKPPPPPPKETTT